MADDVAECIRWVASLPSHVNVDEIVVRPRAQATATEVHRSGYRLRAVLVWDRGKGRLVKLVIGIVRPGEGE